MDTIIDLMILGLMTSRSWSMHWHSHNIEQIDRRAIHISSVLRRN